MDLSGTDLSGGITAPPSSVSLDFTTPQTGIGQTFGEAPVVILDLSASQPPEPLPIVNSGDHIITITDTPTPLISIEELLSSQEILLQIEQLNKTNLELLNVTTLKKNLLAWAAAGFTDSINVYSFPIQKPPVVVGLYTCSDGVNRTIWDYIVFFLGYPILTLVERIQGTLKDIKLTFSLQENPSAILNIHASK
jgi:hypothetical protein